MSKILLNETSASIQFLCDKDKRFAKLFSIIGPINYEPHHDPYAFLVHEIIEQMLSVKVARKIYQRLEVLCGGTINPTTISSLSNEDIRGIGTSKSKVAYIRSLTDSVVSEKLDFEEIALLSDMDAISKLTSIRGIGTWTAKMFLIFVLDRQDILPYEDKAFLQGYGWLYKTNDTSQDAVVKKCKKWKPYSSIASRYMYRAVDLGLTKTEFHLYK